MRRRGLEVSGGDLGGRLSLGKSRTSAKLAQNRDPNTPLSGLLQVLVEAEVGAALGGAALVAG